MCIPSWLSRAWALWVAVLTVLAVLPGCAKRADTASMSEPMTENAGYYGDAEESAVSMGRAAPMRKSAPPSRPSAAGAPPPPPPPQDSEAVRPEETPAARMVHYSGFARLRVERVETATDELVALATGMGGFAERIGGGSLTLRVPVARFDEAMEAVLAFGEVLDKSISAQDVTDAFMSVELRLKTARGTLARLQALLAKAEDENEKLALLREIHRVSEQIDLMEGQSRTLAALAEMSRITVQLVPREALAWRTAGSESAAFAWISRLSPFQQDVVQQGRRLVLDVPEGLVELDLKRRFVAESADGARFWAGRLDNDPVGDGSFWIEAVQSRLSRDFESAERSTLGRFEVLRLVDRGDNPYTWYILVNGDGKDLEVVEIYYPSTEHEARYHEAVKAVVLAAGGGAA